MFLGGYIAEIAGLSPNTTEEEVMEFLSYCGEIEHLEIIRLSENTCNAYVAFKDIHALETAILLSGATIANRCVSISEIQMEESDLGSDDTPKAEGGCSSRETSTNQFSSTPGEAMTMEQAFTTMISKGYKLSKDAVKKAKEFDESYQLSSAAAAKAADLSGRIGLTDKINSGVEAAKSIDEKYNVSGVTMSVACFTARVALAATNAVVSTRSFARGALWVSNTLDRASKAAADLANKGMQK